MGTQANVLTPQQMRCIYALARGGGISNDDLHAVVFTTTGKDSIRLLTTADAKQVIDRLKRLTGQETTAPHNRPTKEQVAKIYALAAKLELDNVRVLNPAGEDDAGQPCGLLRIGEIAPRLDDLRLLVEAFQQGFRRQQREAARLAASGQPPRGYAGERVEEA